MKNLILSTAVLALTAGAALADAHGVVRMGTEGAYPPYNFLNDAGEVDGFERELGDELCMRAELTCEWVTNEWDSASSQTSCPATTTQSSPACPITDERKEVIAFSRAVHTARSIRLFLTMNDATDLTTGVIAAQAGTIQAAYVAQSTGATLVEFATPDETVAAVRKTAKPTRFWLTRHSCPQSQKQTATCPWYGQEVMMGGGIGMGMRESPTQS